MTRQHHPVADLFPMLPDDELKDLAADIAERGLLQAIVLDKDGRILDGRNRYAACELASVEPEFETYDGDDPDGYALAVNIARRHLTKGQIAMVTIQATDSFKLKERGWATNAAKRQDVPEARISQARTVLEFASDLTEAVVNGDVPLHEAYKSAQERKREAEELKAKRNRLSENAPDLLTLVEEERMAIGDAIAALEAREEKARQEEEERRERERREEADRLAKLREQEQREELARQQALNAYNGAVDGLTSALSYAQAYTPPEDIPDNYVPVDTFIKRVETLLDLVKDWSAADGEG